MSGAVPAGDLPRLLEAAETAARAGGAIVADRFGDARDVRAKAPGDWVSEADLASEETVRATLERLAPGVPVFGEEGGGDRGEVGWFVDPLDGTANFLHGLVAVGVSVALVDRGRPAVGVVHAPLLDRTYAATRGGGAFRDGEPIRVADRPPARAICATGFPFRHKEVLGAYLEVLGPALAELEDLRRVGAASLDLCWTAEGVFDGYFELGLGTWDVAAGGLLVTEAGGLVTDWDGDPDAWLGGDVVAGSPAVHPRLRELTGRYRRPDA